MSKTTPVRWWRDDATRYHAARPRTLTVDAMARIMGDYVLDLRIRAAGGWRGFPVIEPRDSLLERAHPPDPWEQFARRCWEASMRSPVLRRVAFQCSNCDLVFDWTTEKLIMGFEVEIKTIGSRYCPDPACIDAEIKAHGVPRERVMKMRRALGRVVPADAWVDPWEAFALRCAEGTP